MNAASWRGLIVTIVIALAAGFVGARLGAMGSSATERPASENSVRQSVDALLARDYKLTGDQKRQIEEIDERFTRTHNFVWADINNADAKLASAVAINMPNGTLENVEDMNLSPDAKSAIQGIEEGVGRLHTESILYVLQVRDVLTPEQRKNFDEHIIMALMRSP
jgi:nickel and cobalt resistance protein CnrR